jgi:hypothetical protein
MADNRLRKFNRFNSEYENELGKHPTYKKAYEATEEKFRNLIGYNKYSDYNSFRNVRSRVIKGK